MDARQRLANALANGGLAIPHPYDDELFASLDEYVGERVQAALEAKAWVYPKRQVETVPSAVS